MSPLASLWDTWLIARFELLRAIRTWQALALSVLYVVVITGFSLMFVGMLWAMENQVARALGVPPTDYPGSMTAKLLEDGELREVLGYMIGTQDRVDRVLSHPVLALFHCWIGMRVTPFLAAMTSSEAISIDMRSRALRFEVLRTGRLELVAGRFVGQALLAAVACFIASGGVWVVGMMAMVGNHPLGLAWSLAVLTLRIWVFCLPFIGLGVACSQLTASPAWSRVLAVAGTACGWVAYLVVNNYSDWAVPWLWDIVLQIMPWEWRDQLWEPGVGWLLPAVICAAMGLAVMSLGYLRFMRRDL